MLADGRPLERGWLAPWAVLSRQGPAVPDRAGLGTALAWQAVIDVYGGDLARARRDAADALAQAGPTDRRWLAAAAAAVELHGPSTDLPDVKFIGMFDGIATRRGAPVPADVLFGVYPEDCKGPYQAAIAAAQRGDGRPLVDVLHRCAVFWRPGPLLAVVARVKTGRAALADALTWYRDESLPNYDFPFGWIDYVVLRRDLVGLAGADAERARWQAIARREVAALADRDRVTALLFWNL